MTIKELVMFLLLCDQRLCWSCGYDDLPDYKLGDCADCGADASPGLDGLCKACHEGHVCMVNYPQSPQSFGPQCMHCGEYSCNCGPLWKSDVFNEEHCGSCIGCEGRTPEGVLRCPPCQEEEEDR